MDFPFKGYGINHLHILEGRYRARFTVTYTIDS